MKFNVHKWNGKSWQYVATTVATNEQIAAQLVATKFNLKGRFASYPHIDNVGGTVTSNTILTVLS